ncbi:bifunctional metallophosphatase/5'-nucleotidase [Paenibacillus beijingensis]|uniref:Metallophosphoesterase n=1 Tax=Paenibacillus beijingensis TaxID=1126833 RepID=A0A0D5NKT5_9BACL|nr:bifunctional UDP-sugar hydrolase/5'-nucleotidase [Paenibacillus beijingensis]AJY75964.1 metallophosphoesterase [Paenibacillus beijingensis]
MTHNEQWQPEAVLLHSNDLHSRLEEAARMATYIDDQRRIHGSGRVLAVDCGDHMDRMRVETEGSGGLVNVELLNAAGYEAATLGNNEGLTFTAEALTDAYRGHARFAVLAANMTERDSGLLPDWILPQTVIAKGGLKIGLIGVTARFNDFYKLLGWNVLDPMPVVEREVAQLRAKADVVVVLSHLGLPTDRRMAEEIAGIDLILGGHTHHLLEEPLLIGGTTVCAAGKHGERLGRVEIGRDPVSGRPLLRASCVSVADCAPHPEAAAIIGGYLEAGVRALSRTVVRLERELPADAERESPLASLLAAGLKRWTGAQIGIVNAGQLLGGLFPGGVTEGLLHALCPSPINPCRLTLRGRDIRLALEQSLLPEYTGMEIRGFGFRGLVLGTLAVDGLDIHWDEGQPEESKIVSIQVAADGQPLQDEEEYEVGTIDMFTFGIGYLSLQQGKNVRYYLPEFLRDVLAAELQNSEAVAESFRPRWHRAR